MTTDYSLASLTETESLARQMVSRIPQVRIFALNGPVGAGKTTFSQAFGKELGITEPITSPTYTLMQVYTLPNPVHGIKTLVHIDAYRLENSAELQAIGFTDFVQDPHSIILIEWAENVSDILKHENVLWMNFEVNEDTRVCRITY